MINFIFVSLISISFVQAQVCKRTAPDKSFSKALESCQNSRTIQSADKALKGLLTLSESDFCQVSKDEKQNQDIKKKLCSDPNGLACENKGKIFDSNCNYMALESGEAESDPKFIRAQCAADTKWDKFLESHKKECPKNLTANKCKDFLSLKHAEKKAKILRDMVYTKERVAKVRSAYDKVKAHYLKLIEKSSKISPNIKPYLIGRIENTRLAMDESDLASGEHSDCHNVSPGKTSTGIYNSPQAQGTSGREIHFCVGSVATLDYANPYVLIHTMAHELSHSIDPCMVENDMLESGSPSPNFYQRLYADTVTCLRGGKGENGCNGAILNCNDDKGRIDFCEQKYPGQQGCIEQVRMLPNCAIGLPDPTHNHKVSADYKKTGTNEEQIGESFSDFMASEIIADFMEEDKSESSKLDGMLSIASVTSRLHGTCLTTNTPDPHPPGFLRMNRIIMSSGKFRESVGCLQGPPKTNKANVTCPSI